MKTILLIIAIAGILFFAYRKVADYHFKKGWIAAHEKFKNVRYEEFIGTDTLKNVSSGKRNIMDGRAMGYDGTSKQFTYEEVLHKKVKFKNGHIGTIAGGEENALLIEWENGNITGFAQLKDIIEIIK